MKKIIILIFFLAVTGVKSQYQEWAKTFNGSGNSNDQALFVKLDAQQNVYITGRVISTGNNSDICIVKYNSAGVQQWAVTYNGPGNNWDEAAGLAVDISGNIYVAGITLNSSSNYDIVVIKYNSAGLQQWAQIWNGANNLDEESGEVITDNNGNIYVTGSTVTSGMDYNYITLKYNSSGVLQWAKQYNNPINSGDRAMLIACDGINIYVTGTSTAQTTGTDFLTIKYSPGGDSLWTARFSGTVNINEIPYGFKADLNGNVYVTGMTQGISSGVDYITIKYNTNGTELWQARYTSPGAAQDIPEDLAIDGSGNVYVTGRTRVNSSYNDFGTVKYNSNGVQQWVAIYDNAPESRDDYGYELAVDNSGNVYVTGNSQASGTDRDALTIKYNSSGIQQWVARYDVTNSEEAYSIALDAAGNVYVTGYQTASNADFLTIKYSQTNGIKQISNEIPEKFSISQNYPNPFNPVTKIRFAITSGVKSETSNVKLVIFDAAGREAETLINEKLQPGTYEADWDAANYPSGVYFYTIQTGGFKQTKKMMLIK